MALNTPQFGIPTSLVFTPRDYAKDMVARQEADKTAVQNLFKFGTQVYDYLQSRKQANLMDEDTKNRKALEEQIAADKARIELLKKDLATLQGGV
jgi:hypothetical protein